MQASALMAGLLLLQRSRLMSRLGGELGIGLSDHGQCCGSYSCLQGGRLVYANALPSLIRFAFRRLVAQARLAVSLECVKRSFSDVVQAAFVSKRGIMACCTLRLVPRVRCSNAPCSVAYCYQLIV